MTRVAHCRSGNMKTRIFAFAHLIILIVCIAIFRHYHFRFSARVSIIKHVIRYIIYVLSLSFIHTYIRIMQIISLNKYIFINLCIPISNRSNNLFIALFSMIVIHAKESIQVRFSERISFKKRFCTAIYQISPCRKAP